MRRNKWLLYLSPRLLDSLLIFETPSFKADIYVNGELTVYFPEDVRIPITPNRMAMATLSRNSLKFEYCSWEKAIALLKGQYAVGNVEVRIVQLRSK